MAQPIFQTPGQQPSRKRFASPGARMAFFDSIGRRCDGNSRNCWRNRATWEFDVIAVNANGDPVSDQRIVRSCAKHRIQWTDSSMYRIVAERRLLDISIEKQDGRIYVIAPYNEQYVKTLKALGARRETSNRLAKTGAVHNSDEEWSLPEDKEMAVRRALREAFGTDGGDRT